jgi:outer membrane protein assembly factor BamB
MSQGCREKREEFAVVTKQFIAVVALSVLSLSLPCRALAQSPDARALLEKTGIKGGLCLVIGAKDEGSAGSLAGQGALYVQVLQPDAKLAVVWGATVARSASRENIGVRDAAFDAADYGSDLFNLIVVENAGAIGKATLEDFNRLLVPGGVVAFRGGVGALAESAQSLGLTVVAVPSFGGVFRKAVREIPFKPSSILKWRAGARAHWSSGWSRHGAAGGVFYYTEKLEVQGDPKGGQQLLSVRDAFNGRLLWTRENASVLAGTRDGRLLVVGGKLALCDARTGMVQTEFPDEAARNARGGLAVGESMIILTGPKSQAYSSDGKKLWESAGGEVYAASTNRVFMLSGGSLLALDLKDGKALWKSPAFPSWGSSLMTSDKGVYAIGNWASLLVAYDPESGKELWRYSNVVPKGAQSYFHAIRDKVYAVAHGRAVAGESDILVTTLDGKTGAVESKELGPKQRLMAYMCAPPIQGAGDYLFYSFSAWVDPKALTVGGAYFAHPSCHFGTYLANGMAYNFPSRKYGPLQGISAVGPADMVFDHEPGGKGFQKYSDAPAAGEAAQDTDWVMFRGNSMRANSTKAAPGDKLSKLWEISLGLVTNNFGRLNSVRSGLTQAVSAYGLVIVADMEGQRIVAVDAQTGKEMWVFAVGSRVEFSPSLYKGLCLFAAKDGFVYCLNAKTGALCWKRLIPARNRLIGGQDKLESLWSVTSDVMIENGVGYACAGLDGGLHGGIRAMAFRPESGDLVWGQCYTSGTAGLFSGNGNPTQVVLYNAVLDTGTGKVVGGRRWPDGGGILMGNNPMDDYLAGGVSVPRNGEDRVGVLLANGIIEGKTVAFDEALSVAFMCAIGQEKWENGYLSFYAKNKRGKENLWQNNDDLIVDDIVMTPTFIYVVGHHYREAKGPELRVVSRKDGKTLASHDLNAVFPAWSGMSVAGDKVLIATGEGKLICYQGSKN